jgi:hypothetical protein
MTTFYIHLGVFLCISVTIIVSKFRDNQKIAKKVREIQEGTTEYAIEKKKRYNSIVENYKKVFIEIQNFNNDYPRGNNEKV